MLKRVLIAFFAITCVSSTTLAFSPVCSTVLNPGAIYEQVKHAVNRHTLSSDLTPTQKAKIEYIVARLEHRVNEFDRHYNRILAPYGTSFLPRLREKLEAMSAEFRQKNWTLINELMRYINTEGVRFRDLDIFKAADSLRDNPASRFIHNSDEVYFGIDFFVNTLKLRINHEWAGAVWRREIEKVEGYRILTHETSHDINSQVRTFNEDSSNDVYPGTLIRSLQTLEDDGLPFSGFPLTREFLDFLQNRGDSEGYLNVGALPVLDEVPTFWSNVGVSSSVNQSSIDQVSRYHHESSSYLSLIAEDGNVYPGFFDVGQYAFDENNVLLIPGVRVSMETPGVVDRVLRRDTPPALVIGDEGTLAAYPTHYEFFIALIFRAHQND